MRVALRVLLLGLGVPILLSCEPDGRFDGGLGSELRYADVTEGTALRAALSPNGERVAMVLMGHLWIVPREGGSASLLTDLRQQRQPYRSVTWTNDGTALVAATERVSETWEIRLIDPDSGTVLGRLARPWQRQDVFRPHPSGASSVLVTHPDSASTSFWIHDLRSGDSISIFSVDDGEVKSFDVSPDAGRLAWESDGVVTEVDLRTGVPLWSSDSSVPASSPSYSLSGERLAFLSNAEGESHLIVRGDANVMTSVGSAARWSPPSWTPEGDTVLVVAASRPHLLPVVPAAMEESGPEVGRSVSFSARIPVRRWSGLRRPEVHLPGGRYEAKGVLSPSLSPSGDRIAFAALGDLWIIDVEADTPGRVTDSPADDSHPVWSPDETRLAFISTSFGAASTVSVIRLDSPDDVRAVGSLADVPTPLEAELAWSPDGRYLAYTGAAMDAGTGIAVWDEETRSQSLLDLPPSLGLGTDLIGWTAAGDSVLVPSGDDVAVISIENGGWRLDSRLEGRARRTAWTPDFRHRAWNFGGRGYIAGAGIPGDSVQIDARYPRHFSWDDSGSILAFQSGRSFVVHEPESGSVAVLEPRIEYDVPSPDAAFVLANIDVVDGRGGPVQQDMDVFVEEGRIQAVRSAGESAWPERVTVIDGEGMTVLPGLINLHVHHQPPFIPSGAHLYYGVTTVRDMAQRADWMQGQRERLAAGAVTGPRLFHVGGWVDVERGQDNFSWIWPVDAQDEATLRDLVWTLSELGVWGVKTRAGDPQLWNAISQAAHDQGLPVTTHSVTPGLLGAGLDGNEHARLTDWLPRDAPRQDDAMSTALTADLCVTPTLVVGFPPSVLELAGDSLPTASRWLPPSWAARDLRALEVEAGRPRTWESAKWRSIQDAFVQDLHEAGVTLAAGTDNGPSFQPRIYLEIQALAQAGLPPASAIRAATLGAAECLGVDHVLGSVEVGKVADLLVVNGDPLQDLAALEDVQVIILGGRKITRAELLEEIR